MKNKTLKFVSFLLFICTNAVFNANASELKKPVKYIIDDNAKLLKRWIDNESKSEFDIKNTGLTVLAVMNNCSLQTLTVLIDSGANINKKDKILEKSLLHHSVENKDLSCMYYLLSNNVKVETYDKFYNNPMFYAVMANNKEAAKALYLAGLSPLTKNTKDMNSIDLAKKLDRMYLFDFLENPEAGY